MKTRRTYKPIRIDMTPFVSVALILIVFFVWLKTVQTPNLLSVWNAQGCRKGIEPEHSKRVLEILLLNRDTIQFCHFPIGSSCRANFVMDLRGSGKLRKALFHYKKDALIPGELAIVIRLIPESTFGSFTGVLNELRIAGNLPYLLAY